jgi:hypothetical protein
MPIIDDSPDRDSRRDDDSTEDNSREHKARCVAQMVELLTSKCDALSLSITSTKGEKKRSGK